MNSFEKSIFDYIKARNAVSCIELSNEFGKGDYWLTTGNNVIVGFDLSDDLSKALFNLTSRWEVVHLPCNQVIYLLDGGYINLPIAENIPKNVFKEPHWQPSLFYVYEDAVKHIEKEYKNKPKELKFLLNLMKKQKEAVGNVLNA